jgi:NAD(P)H-flavin reductase
MIQERLSQPDSSPVCLVMGNRYKEDMLYHQEWLELQKADPRFRYVSTLSKEEAEMDGVQKGYVHGHYADFVSAHPEVHVYVCGWELMCKEARQRLKDMGLTRRQYFFEQYDG